MGSYTQAVEFALWCEAHGLPSPMHEYRFHETRQWRFDHAWPEHMVALEVEGGAFKQGRHVRGKGFLDDMAKYNAAALSGWMLLRTVPRQLTSAATLDMLVEALEGQGE